MKRNLSVLCTALAFGLFVFGGCVQDESVTPVQTGTLTSTQVLGKKSTTAVSITSDALDAANVALQVAGKPFRVAYAEYITNGTDNAVGQTVYAKNVGNKQLTADFVPFDSRRAAWSGPVNGANDDITYAVDMLDGSTNSGLTADQTSAEIDAAMNTWSQVSCSHLPLVRVPNDSRDLGVYAFYHAESQATIRISSTIADIVHAGFNDFEYGGGTLGVTYTFVFVDGAGNPTDIDNNGKLDVSWREIYYDRDWNWRISPALTGDYPADVQSIALHEAGHGLSQAHFGKVFITESNGKLHAAPAAVMNAVYYEVRQGLLGTDIAGHCSIWATWPNH
jgi:hypothetical protein